MAKYLALGPTPTDEPCVQITNDGDYIQEARAECRRYIVMLERRFVNLPAGCWFIEKPIFHDFGTDYEVAVAYDMRDDKCWDATYFIRDHLPAYWTDDEVFDLETRLAEEDEA